MSIIDTINQEHRAFEAKTGRLPAELYLGQESYVRLITSLRDITPPCYQQEYSGLTEFAGMRVHIVMHERNYIGLGI